MTEADWGPEARLPTPCFRQGMPATSRRASLPPAPHKMRQHRADSSLLPPAPHNMTQHRVDLSLPLLGSLREPFLPLPPLGSSSSVISGGCTVK